MKRTLLALSCGWFVLMTGCIPSLHPLYTSEDLVFEEGLLGQWSPEDSKETWTFTQASEKQYELLHVDDEGKSGKFLAHLLELDGRLFLDLYPMETDKLQTNDLYKLHLLPVHTFFSVRQIGPTLQMATLDPDWLKKLLEKEPDLVQHERLDDTIVLTAQPKELQAFLLKHGETPDAWGEFSDMTQTAKQ